MLDNQIINFIDCEMTGLDPTRHELISLGYLKVRQYLDGSIVKFEILDGGQIRLTPERIDLADPMAIKITHYSADEWKGAYGQKEGLGLIAEKIVDLAPVNDYGVRVNKFITAGHNLHNDLAFLRIAMIRHEIEHNFKYTIDTHSLAFSRFFGKADAPKHLSLGAMSDYFGIKNEEEHNALSDARTTFEVYKRLIA